MKEIDLLTFNWKEIQQYYSSGALLQDIIEKFNISRKVLDRATKEGYFIKTKRKYYRTEETKKIISEKRKKYLKENPDKHPWKKSDKHKSGPCETLKSVLKNNDISFIEEYQPLEDRFFSIDIAFPDKKIGLEINGNQHYNKNGTLKSYYKTRHDLIESNGWEIYEIHYSLVYDENFNNNLLYELKNKHLLSKIDYSFYIKKPKTKKNRSKEEYYNGIKLLNDKKCKPIIKKLKNSDIDFSKYGWVGKASKIIGITSQKVNIWMERHMKNFYEEKCYKRKINMLP